MDLWIFFLIPLPLQLGLFPPTHPQAFEPRRDSVVVTGAFDPIPLEEADRAVRAWDLGPQQRLLAATVVDLLRLDPSIDIRARGPNAVQTDVSIRGGGFGQTLVLLNGLRLNDAQSGHHSMNLPLPIDAVSRVEVLKGTGSAFYGSDAVGGVIHLLPQTSTPGFEFRVRGAAGNFGSQQQAGSLGFGSAKAGQRFSFSRDFSTGFQPNRDYRNLALSSSSWLRTALGNTDLLLASADRPFGAQGFYGNFPSWERTRTWFASLRQELGARTEAAFGFRRNTDLFVLERYNPARYTNRHATESYQGVVRRRDPVGRGATLSYGAEYYHDTIASSNLGNRRRDRGAAYAALDLRQIRRFSLTIGARQEFFTGGIRQFSPTASAGFWASPNLKLRAGAGHAFRVPTYTDLFYIDPANRGNPNLRPESAWSYEGGLDWNAARGRLQGEFTLFHRREQDGIDYIRPTLTDIWRATNISRLRFTGLEAGIRAQVAAGQRLGFAYTALRGRQTLNSTLFSKYVFNYPTHSILGTWEGSAGRHVAGRSRFGLLDRRGRSPYAVWDVSAPRATGRLRPYVQLTNLNDARFQEVLGVDMPGRGVLAGLEIVFAGA
ncbi:MAG TPA: TonB-dependent receptor, partial [Solibacterales bacterium]|nr:TonB-dependent receptor [Bryobacterales bacterium]